MARSFLHDSFLSSSSSEDEFSINSDDSTSSTLMNSSIENDQKLIDTRSTKRQNIMLKLYNRERTGYFAENSLQKVKQTAFKTVPSRLSFCLKDIVPYCYLKGHVFMGLTACGQYLISYKFEFDVSDHNYDFTPCCKYELFFWIYRPHNLLVKYYKVCLFDDHGVDNLKTVSMTQWTSNMGIVIVHGTSESDIGDSYLTIVSVPKLGCIDCRQLRDEYYNDSLDGIRCGALCIRCNLTVHMKYSRSESDPKYNPKINLNCPDRILIFSDGLIHMINVNLELNKPLKLCSNSIDISYISKRDNRQESISFDDQHEIKDVVNDVTTADEIVQSIPLTDLLNQDVPAITNVPLIREKTKPESIVARIIADFAECETADSPSQEKYTCIERSPARPSTSSARQFDELVITCGSSIGGSAGNSNNTSLSSTSANYSHSQSNNSGNTSSSATPNRVRLISHRSHRQIVANNLIKSSGNIKTVDLQSNSNTTIQNKNLDKAAKAYEFSEDNEKCEKISIFRKRRLAEKKYEFSEDNSENIIPFAKLRSTAMKSFSLRARQQTASLSPSSNHSGNGVSQSNLDLINGMSSGSSLPLQPPLPHTHRASPNHGFRSPCGSPVGNRYIMSPPGRTTVSTTASSFCGRSPTYTKPFSSPHRHLGNKHTYYDALAIDNPMLSPRSISGSVEADNFDGQKSNSGSSTTTPLSEVKPSNIYVMFGPTNNPVSMPNAIEKNCEKDKPICSKKLVRRYVEEDDATSVITSEEDDCISAGYHTSLPVEVHGACYSNMQMISNMSYQKLKCPSVTITQHTFDLETLTYYIANYLCSMHNKKYVFFYDWAYEPVTVCPLSSNLTSILIVRFAALELKSSQNNVGNNKLCLNCSSNQSVDCVFHRKNYECSALFTWNIDTGDWNVLDYGDLMEVSPATIYKHSTDLNNAVKQLANDLWHPSFGDNLCDSKSNANNTWSTFNSNNSSNCDIFNNLRILDSCTDKSKEVLTDYDNSIEFIRSAKSATQYFNLFSSTNDY